MGGGTEAVAFSSSASTSMADRAYNYLIESLSQGQLKGGDVIHESRLAERLMLSRTPVRDALGRIEAEGLLVRAGRVLLVRRVTIEEFLDLLYVRRLIEPEAAALACGSIDPGLVASLRARVEVLSPDATDMEVWSLDEDIHLGIIDALHNDYLANLVRNLRRRTRLFELTEFTGVRTTGRDEHLRLLEALAGNAPAAAKTAMLDHLDGLRAKVIERIRQL
jgi:DNA-binding GntR family transcriptional regulator